jgi:thermolysin metallopeptidase-like protein/type IX secretion system substrate protein
LNGITVSGIGIDKAARIAKGNLLNNMQSGSMYADARTGAIAVATQIWGACSNETIQTTNAWAACGVGGTFNTICLFNIVGWEFLCSNSTGYGTWTVDILPSETVTWTYPTWWNVTISGAGNNKLTLNSFNTSGMPPLDHSVILNATSTSGASDSHYIWVAQCFAPPCDDGGSFLISPPNHGIAPAKEKEAEKVSVYPNPAMGKITVTTDALEGSYRIEVFNTLGNILMTEIADGSVFELDSDKLPAGTYYLRVNHPYFQEVVTFIKL